MLHVSRGTISRSLFVCVLLLLTQPLLASQVRITDQTFLDSGPYQQRLMLTHEQGNLTLLLSPSAATASLQVMDDNSSTTSTRPPSFSGVIEHLPGSWVRVSLYDNQIDGVISSAGKHFRLKNHGGKTRISALGAVNDAHTALPVSPKTPTSTAADEVNAPPVTRVASVAIVVDSQFNDYHGGHGLDKALAIMNSVDGIYRTEFGLALSIEKAVVFTNPATDPHHHGSISIEQMLRRFRDYRMQDSRLHDVCMVHLFTGNNNNDRPVGLAWIDTACRSDGFDVSLSTPYRHDVLLTAHEVAHNLGATHDSETGCRSSNRHIMWTTISSRTSQHFSDCTRVAIERSLAHSGHLDALDLQVRWHKQGPQSVTAAIRNNDTNRATPPTRLTIKLPDNIDAVHVSGNCQSPANRIDCSVGPLDPGQEKTIVMSLARLNNQPATLYAELSTTAFRDVVDFNNEATLELAGGSPTAALTGLAGGGGGSNGLAALSALLAFAIWLYCCRCDAGQQQLNPTNHG